VTATDVPLVHVTIKPMGYVPEVIRPLRRVEFEKLAELGAFDEDERIELIRGALVPMNAIGSRHNGVVARITRLFVLATDGRATVTVQGPIAASDDSEPQPDLMLVPLGDYDDENPTAAFLLIEVADSSLEYDRGVKLGIYAEAKVPEYWIIDVKGRRIEVYTEPQGLEYRNVRHFGIGESVSPLHFPDVVFAVSDIIKR
jgi:Uma2 family endonuclease